MTMPRKSKIVASGSRERLAAAAKRLMANGGYERITTAAIAREAGSSESQLIRYFGSKSGLLVSIFNENWAVLNARLGGLKGTKASAVASLGAVFAMIVGILRRDAVLAKLFLLEGRRRNGDNAEVVLSQGYRDFFGMIVSLIERGQRDGTLSTALKAKTMASALIGAAEGMLRDQLLDDPKQQLRAASEAHILAVLGGLIVGLRPRSM